MRKASWDAMMRVSAVGLVVAASAFGGLARAQSAQSPNDVFVYRLGEPCTPAAGTPCVGQQLADDRFQAFVNEMAVSIASFNLQPPETTGFSGFNVAFEYAAAFVNKTAKMGASNCTDATNPTCQQFYWPIGDESARNEPLEMPMAHFRKGFPFPPIPGLGDFNIMSLEVGGRAGWITGSHYGFGMLEVKWALNEGFTFLPDLGVRGFVSRLIGPTDIYVTAAGFDIGVGKQIAVGGMMTITPYLGWNLIFAQGDSNVIDFNPDRPKYQAGCSTPGCDAYVHGTEQTDTFDSVNMLNNLNNRFYFGLRLIAYVVEVGVEASYTQLPGVPNTACSSASSAACIVTINGTAVQTRSMWTLGGKIGLDY